MNAIDKIQMLIGQLIVANANLEEQIEKLKEELNGRTNNADTKESGS